jgi:hypothetical protein
MTINDIVTLKKFLKEDIATLPLGKIIEQQKKCFKIQWYSEDGAKLLQSFSEVNQEEIVVVESVKS